MFSKSRLTLLITVATLALGAPVATAMPLDARGEHAIEQSAVPVSSGSVGDLRGDAAREPFESPVVVEVSGPVASDFDWAAGVIGLGAGAALVLLTAAAVLTTRRRHAARIV